MTATALEKLQHEFLNALLNPSAPHSHRISESLLPGATINATACLAIYQRSYILRLRQCLGEQFPATHYALGENVFNDFADYYLEACPSNSYTLYDLGKRFSAWLEDTRPDRDLPADQREDWIDFMVDLTRYEHELFRLFDAPGHEGGEWPAQATPDDALALQPCLTLASYGYPVAWYYHEIRAGRRPAFPPKMQSHAVILRRDHQTATFPVTPVQYRFLEMLHTGNNISQSLEAIAHWAMKPLEQVIHSWQTEVRQAWLAAGFFIRK